MQLPYPKGNRLFSAGAEPRFSDAAIEIFIGSGYACRPSLTHKWISIFSESHAVLRVVAGKPNGHCGDRSTRAGCSASSARSRYPGSAAVQLRVCPVLQVSQDRLMGWRGVPHPYGLFHHDKSKPYVTDAIRHAVARHDTGGLFE